MIDAIDAKIGDKVTIPVDFSGVLGENSPQKLLALMLIESEVGFVDFDADEIVYEGERVAFGDFGVAASDYNTTLMLNYTISQSYEGPNGRYSLVFNNAAIINCHSVFGDLIDALLLKAAPLKEKDPEKY